MFKNRSIKWKMTILSAIAIFLIFMICNIIQLILIQTQTFKQEEQILLKRSMEIQDFFNRTSETCGWRRKTDGFIGKIS